MPDPISTTSMAPNAHPTPRTVRISYGEHGYAFPLDIPGLSPEVFLPANPRALENQEEAFKQAVRNPIGSPPLLDVAAKALETPKNEGRPPKVVIAVADHTRPVPDHLLIPWIAAELGIADECVTILIGTGTHRGSTEEELRKMLGSATERFTVVNHDCQDTGWRPTYV